MEWCEKISWRGGGVGGGLRPRCSKNKEFVLSLFRGRRGGRLEWCEVGGGMHEEACAPSHAGAFKKKGSGYAT